jgi:acyl-CoA thioester hydrolase
LPSPPAENLPPFIPSLCFVQPAHFERPPFVRPSTPNVNRKQPMHSSAPFQSRIRAVEPQWIDYNGHMNMAYYNVLFDRCADDAFEVLGMGPDYVNSRNLSVYTAEIHVCYIREIHEGDRTVCSFQIVDHDEKRLHIYKELRHEDGWLSATSETLYLHIDMSGPKVAPFPPDIFSNVSEMAAAHVALGRPERAGRSIGIKRKST